MNFDLSPEQKLIRDTARDLATREILPVAAEIDRSHKFPKKIFARLGELGLLGTMIPERWGGAGMDALSYAVALEEIARACASTAVVMSVQCSLVCAPILTEGTDAQRTRWLPDLTAGKKIGCFALSEPEAGSDAKAQRTRATKTKTPDGDGWILNGTKNFITNAPVADVMIVFATTDATKGSRGITAFLVPMDTPGLKVEYYHHCFNMPSDHAEVSVRNVRVPHAAIVGREGKGLEVAQNFVHQNRIRQAAQSVGVARYCVQESVKYARERKTFGKPLATHQAIQFPIAEMHAEVEMVRNYVFKVAQELDRKPAESVSDQVAIANFRANRLACNAADLAIQVHGGIGYTRGKPFEHIYRHFRRYRITEGSDEVQIRKIAAYLFGYAGPNKQFKKKAVEA
jgi:acyl-CoA dehydrogenase